ncbi:MAG: CerR family C-terminal domain-containing protein [Kiritimatiellaceae bacterium]|nr:CerR family C-terminal domain-containing protein [Kiritimatiellaceae bacterium]
MNLKPSTKDRLIRSACEIFAEKGYRDSTVAEICKKAKANIAAVNYHFGDKESLYDAVWRHAFAITSEMYPIDGGLSENPTLEEILFRYASAILHRIFSNKEAGLFPKLLSHEMANPTLALEKIASDALFPQAIYLRKAIVPALGPDVDEMTIRRCMHSITGQCAFFNFSRGLREQVIGKNTMTEEEIEQHARHIARFSMGGLEAIKGTIV